MINFLTSWAKNLNLPEGILFVFIVTRLFTLYPQRSAAIFGTSSLILSSLN